MLLLRITLSFAIVFEGPFMSFYSKAARRKVKYALLYFFVVATMRFSRVLPRTWWLGLCSLLGRLIYLVSPNLRSRITSNLRLAFQNEKSEREIHELSRQVVIAIARNSGILLRGFYTATLDEFREYCVSVGEEHAQAAWKKGKGVIFLTAHLGPFETVATELAMKGYNPYIIGSPLKDERLNQLVEHHRTRFGGVLIERGKETIRVMKNIGSGGTMVILIDQNTRVKSIPVNFFGVPCPTPIGATLLALKTGAAVVPVFTHLREDGVVELQFYPEVELTRTGNDEQDLITNTEMFNLIIEREVRKYPAQWVWMHNRWQTANF